MTAWVAFEGAVEPLIWGRATYTILRLPPEVETTLAGARRVEGEIADHPVNLAVSKAPVVDGVFLWAGRSLLDRVGIAPGEVVEVRLRPVDDDVVETPDDLASALHASDRFADWMALSPGRQRSLLYPLSTAKRPETRVRRIAALVQKLDESAGRPR